MFEQISWTYSFSSNNWWKLAIIAIVLKVIFRLMYVWTDDIDSVAYSITTAIVDEVNKEGTKPTHISHRVFKYDGFYDTKKLIDENGVEFKLNDADTQFLKERGAK